MHEVEVSLYIRNLVINGTSYVFKRLVLLLFFFYRAPFSGELQHGGVRIVGGVGARATAYKDTA